MIGLAFLATLLVALLMAAKHYYPLARREMMRERRMHAAETDDHQCDVCQRVTGTRELVMLHDDAALCCLSCADLLKFRPAALRQEAA